MKKVSPPPNTVMTWAKVAAKPSNTVPVHQGATKKIPDSGLGTEKSDPSARSCNATIVNAKFIMLLIENMVITVGLESASL